MTNLFVFGTLCHRPLLEAVAGEPVTMRQATLADHEVRGVAGEVFPVLVPCEGAAARGVLVEGMSDAAMARMDFYESIFAYSRHPAEVLTDTGPVRTEMYLPPAKSGVVPDEAAWSLAEWVPRHGAINTFAAMELMEKRGSADPAELAELMPFIRARAWARVMARETGPVTRRRSVRTGDIEVTSHRATHDGFFRLKQFRLQTRGYDGTPNPEIRREAYLAFDAALVLPYDPARDLVLLIEQLRYGPLWRGDPEPYTFEPVAGLIDAGESPEATARREAMEEAGVEIDELIKLPSGYPAPGYVTEFHHCFLAVTELDPDQAGLGGLDAENEDIRSHVMPFETAMALVESGEIRAIPLIMMLMSLATRREGLRARP